MRIVGYGNLQDVMVGGFREGELGTLINLIRLLEDWKRYRVKLICVS